MQVFRDAAMPQDWLGAVVAIGNFDGVHQGHRAMLEALVAAARSTGTRSLVFTFDPHPLALIRPEVVPMALTTMSRRLELLSQTGIDGVLVYPTNLELLDLSAEAFFDEIICRKLGASGLVEGPNFCFGKNRGGTIERLKGFCEQKGMSLKIVAPVEIQDRMVSSTTVRQAILDGDLETVNRLLTCRYQIEGKVVSGDRRGRTIGFPTANLADIETALPRDGVYAGRTRVGETWWPTAINIGPNPTFAEQRRKVEAHLIGFEGDLYGQRVVLEFETRLRDTQRFAGIEELKTQLGHDVARVLEAISIEPHR